MEDVIITITSGARAATTAPLVIHRGVFWIKELQITSDEDNRKLAAMLRSAGLRRKGCGNGQVGISADRQVGRGRRSGDAGREVVFWKRSAKWGERLLIHLWMLQSVNVRLDGESTGEGCRVEMVLEWRSLVAHEVRRASHCI